MTGRVKVYGEEMVIKTVYLPESLHNRIRQLSKDTGKSYNATVVSLLMSADEELAKEILQRLESRRTSDTIDYNKFLSIEEVKQAIELGKQSLQRGIPLERVLEWLPDKVEAVLLSHGFDNVDRREVKKWLAQSLRRQ